MNSISDPSQNRQPPRRYRRGVAKVFPRNYTKGLMQRWRTGQPEWWKRPNPEEFYEQVE